MNSNCCTISSRQLVTNLNAIGDLPSICEPATSPDSTEEPSTADSEIRLALLSLFESTKESELQSNTDLTKIISKFSIILKEVDIIVEPDIIQVYTVAIT